MASLIFPRAGICKPTECPVEIEAKAIFKITHCRSVSLHHHTTFYLEYNLASRYKLPPLIQSSRITITDILKMAMPCWSQLPPEIRILILERLGQDGDSQDQKAAALLSQKKGWPSRRKKPDFPKVVRPYKKKHFEYACLR